jgi:hypothetical protein
VLKWIDEVIRANQEAAGATSPAHWNNHEPIRSKRRLPTTSQFLFCGAMALLFLLIMVLLFL